MIRGFFRLVGLCCCWPADLSSWSMTERAGSPIRPCNLPGLVNSGTISINPASQAFRAWVEATAPWLWTSVFKIILDQPVFAVMGILGILLMLLFRPRKPLIGYIAETDRRSGGFTFDCSA